MSSSSERNSQVSSGKSTAVSTKVYYYLDDNATPYVSVLPISSEKATLGHFKKVFNRRGFKYFCKELDKDIGMEVKVEVSDDSALLRKSANGLFELFLLPSTGTLPRGGGTLPRSAVPSSSHQKTSVKTAMGVDALHDFGQRKRRSMQALNGVGLEGGERREVWGKGKAPSITAQSLSTIVSRRAGEQLAEYTSTSEDPYRFDETASLSLPQIVEVFLPMRHDTHLGIQIVCQEGNIYVGHVEPDSAVGRDGRIEVGDQIIQVNKRSFEELDEKEAVTLLREVASLRKPLNLFVAKRPRNDHVDPLAALASETLPLDISLWVETAVQNTNRQQQLGADSTMGDTTTFNEGFGGAQEEDEDSEEERELYEQRRNGVARAPPLRTEDADRRRENEANEQLCERLSVKMDPWQIARAMARADSGLEIKNRKWLKIVVPMAFIGREMVDWLLYNVGDLPDRKAARKFAAVLLEKGHIRHVVNKLTFTEKCYYVFDESILGMRAAGAETSGGTASGGTAAREATTEVTYIGSPAPGGRGFLARTAKAHRLGRLPPEWDLSPITVANTARRRDCESPVTNDYASMVDDVTVGVSTWAPVMQKGAPPPNTPLSASSAAYALLPPPQPPNPSPCGTEFEEYDDTKRIIRK